MVVFVRLIMFLVGRVWCEVGGSKGFLVDVREVVGCNMKNVFIEDDIFWN